jgi:cobalt-zinc-cadmium efflux system protein
MAVGEQVHDHDHAGHRHDHAGHHHHGAGANERSIALAFAILFVFMVIEGVGGVLSGSLALLADAGHMVSDVAALGMSWLAIHVGKRPADAARSFGYKRLEVLAAFVNGCALFLIAGWVVFEAVRRFAAPVPVVGHLMLAVAVAGTLANVIAFLVLSGGDRANLNVRSAWVHVLGDLIGQIAAVIAATVILATGWYPIDPILSVFVALVILRSAYGIVRASSHILLEGTPPGLDLEAMRDDLKSVIPATADVHHMHVWSLSAEQPMITLHVSCTGTENAESIMSSIRARLREHYGIAHSTIQVEPFGCDDASH